MPSRWRSSIISRSNCPTAPMTANISPPTAVLVSRDWLPDIDSTRRLTFSASSRDTIVGRSSTDRARRSSLVATRGRPARPSAPPWPTVAGSILPRGRLGCTHDSRFTPFPQPCALRLPGRTGRFFAWPGTPPLPAREAHPTWDRTTEHVDAARPCPTDRRMNRGAGGPFASASDGGRSRTGRFGIGCRDGQDLMHQKRGTAARTACTRTTALARSQSSARSRGGGKDPMHQKIGEPAVQDVPPRHRPGNRPRSRAIAVGRARGARTSCTVSTPGTADLSHTHGQERPGHHDGHRDRATRPRAAPPTSAGAVTFRARRAATKQSPAWRAAHPRRGIASSLRFSQ